LTNPNGIFHGMPTWDDVMSRPYRERMAAFRDPETRKVLSAEAVEGTVAQAAPMTDRRGQARGYFNRRWDLVQVFLATKNQALQGKSVAQIAQEQGKSTIDAFLDLSVDEELQTLFQVVERGTDPNAQKEILGSNYTVIGTSDGGARPHSHDRDDLTREGSSMLAVFHQPDAIDDDMIDPDGARIHARSAVRKVIHQLARLGRNGVGVEDGDVGHLPRGDEAIVGEIVLQGRFAGQPVDRLFEGHDLLLAHPVTQQSGAVVQGSGVPGPPRVSRGLTPSSVPESVPGMLRDLMATSGPSR
jgi:N-acyl-D-aspartate/D-glutamate deacylase